MHSVLMWTWRFQKMNLRKSMNLTSTLENGDPHGYRALV